VLRRLCGLAVCAGLLATISTRSGAGTAPAPSATVSAPQAALNEISFADAKLATQFKERIDALKSGGLFKELQLFVVGNVVAVIGEPSVLARDLENLKRIASLIERDATNDPMRLGNAEVLMSDTRSALALKAKLDVFKAPRGAAANIPGLFQGLEFLPSGNVLMVVGDDSAVRRDIETIRRIAFFYERPRAHLQLNLRVVQISGKDKAEVTQMADAVRDMVEAQRAEVVRTFGLLQRYIERQPRLAQANTPAAQLTSSIAALLPSSRLESKPMSLPEMLVRLSLNRITYREGQSDATRPMTAQEMTRPDVTDVSLVAFAALNGNGPRPTEVENDPLLVFPARLKAASRVPDFDTELLALVDEDLTRWQTRVRKVRDDLAQFSSRVEREAKDAESARRLVDWLDEPDNDLPIWVKASVSRSLDSTVRSFPAVVREHAQRSVREVARRYNLVTERTSAADDRLKQATARFARAANDSDAREQAESDLRQLFTELRTAAEELVPAPLALFQDIDAALDTFSPPTDQLAGMFRDYTDERLKLESNAAAGMPVNYAKLQSLESRLNRWLRRVSEVTARSLDEQFYQKYVNDVRLLADKRLNHQRALASAAVDRVPDVARDLLLSGRMVNVFISNSISLQFAPDTQNSVSATIQADLPSESTMSERLAAANTAATQAEAVRKVVKDLDATPILESLLSGGQPVNVKGGLSLQATPSVGFDAGSVTLQLSAQQTLDPSGAGNVTDRVARHEVTNSTISALSYEPMVLSTLTSDITFYDEVGGIPGVRKTPLLGAIINDLPGPLRRQKRQQGVFQASVIILEPIVIPTIEDLMNDHRGWRGKTLPTSK